MPIPLLLASLLAAPGASPAAPAGFVVEKVAGEPEVLFPMFAAFDEQGRLFVAESSGLDLYAELSALTRKCRVKLLEDRDGDGRFEASRVFADGLVFPMGLAWRDGKLFVADPPHLVAFEDRDGDGAADARVEVLGDFGHKDNGSLHGVVFGPDGLLYMTMGSPDGYRIRLARGGVLEGESGALIRCRPDGSEPEVLGRGFVNLIEVVFLPSGEVIGTDNWFQLPGGGLRDALVHVVDGGLYPMHPDTGTPCPVTGPPLPAVSLYPAVALSGLACYRGTMFPGEYAGNLFSAQHNSRKVVRHALEPVGSTFHAVDSDFVTSEDPDFHPADIVEDADGSLLVVDTGGWYVQHCPTGKIRDSRAPGGIYRVRMARPKPVADPWGRELWLEGEPAAALARRLADHRPAVRERAQRELSRRGAPAVSTLAGLLQRPFSASVRSHAVWALHGIADSSALPPLRALLSSDEADGDLRQLAAIAARALALRADRTAEPALRRALESAAPDVRLAAAEALARCGGPDTVPALAAALARDPDRFLEHALVHALHRLATVEQLEALLEHACPRLQKAALLLLDHPPHGRLRREAARARLASPDPALRQAALDALVRHRDWSEEAVTAARRWLAREKLSREELDALRGLVGAFAGDEGMTSAVADALLGRASRTPVETRSLLLDAIARGPSELPPPWRDAVLALVRGKGDELRAEAVRTAAILGDAAFAGDLAALAEEEAAPSVLRLEALRAVTVRRPGLSTSAFRFLLDCLRPDGDPVQRLTAAEVVARSRLDEGQLIGVLAAVRDDVLVPPAVILPLLSRGASGAAAHETARYLEEALRAGSRLPAEDVQRIAAQLPAELEEQGSRLIALSRQGDERLIERLRAFEPLLSGGDPTRGRAVFLGRKAACSTCHKVGSEGGEVGPDLTRVGAGRAGRDLLESVLLPSSTFAQGYETYVAVAEDGTVSSGIIARQTGESVVLRGPGGGETRLSRASIRSLERGPTSLMPDGFERLLGREEMRDLLAFLGGLR